MTDDLIEVAGAVAADIAIDKAAKKQRWVRSVKVVIGLLYLALIASAAYVTVKYP
jgi:hypothetical protein